MIKEYQQEFRYLRCLVICCFLVLFCFSQQTAYADEEKRPLAQNFTLKSHQGKNIKLSELRGQVVLINFWASWCSTCIQQLPILNKFQSLYKSRGFKVLAVNIDENTKKALSITRKQKLGFPVLFDRYNHVSRDYSVSSIPISFLIDRDGFVRYSLNATKINQQKKTRQRIKELLDE